MSRDIALNIAINAGQAVSVAERLRAELEATEQAVEGLSATEITARGFSDAATEIEGMRRAAEALGDALGPELSSKLGANGFAGLITDARTAGATFDEIIADADTLAAGVRDLDTAMGNVDTGGLSGIAPAADIAVGGVRRVGDEAGRSRQALGQVGGEAIQQFGSMLGPLEGVSYELGAVADQALSGRSSLSQMAATAGPLIGVGLAVGIIGNDSRRTRQPRRLTGRRSTRTRRRSRVPAMRLPTSSPESLRPAR
ncbi:MAG: hypothetical protein M3501_02090 [Actinomycetota bacterium]|nr:hypothetical protein [Actinomycetota bacterium]